jgi:putative ABC transport system ATP-binding protein
MGLVVSLGWSHGVLFCGQVLPAMFVVKSHAAEAFERRKFERLAKADWQAHLGKKRMKAFIPEVITAVYAATAIALFGVGTWVISQGKFDGAGMVAFVMSLVLLIEPIQVTF